MKLYLKNSSLSEESFTWHFLSSKRISKRRNGFANWICVESNKIIPRKPYFENWDYKII